MLDTLKAIVAGGGWHDDGTWVYEPPSESVDPFADAEAIIAEMEGRTNG